ncbi:MAG TPA: anaerobic ribonucleoside-triphosphate reductase activating protein [Bacteroidales bacterium]|nr:anaerobic ribonucleoside-triphosphate reductase activating protein [Bacteroidales bacterium]
MKIGGFEKQSLIDWEGKIAAVIFTKGCNFRCSYCHNPDLVYPELIRKTEDIPEKIIFQYLLSRKNWLDGVVITGGEPTIHKDLDVFIKRIKDIDYKVKLDTNGSSPEMLKHLIDSGLVDCVAMDIKTVLNVDKYNEICGVGIPGLLKKVQDSIAVLNGSGIEIQYRTTIVPHFHTKDTIVELQKRFSGFNYRLQECRFT